jgi:hypothetical protein
MHEGPEATSHRTGYPGANSELPVRGCAAVYRTTTNRCEPTGPCGVTNR